MEAVPGGVIDRPFSFTPHTIWKHNEMLMASDPPQKGIHCHTDLPIMTRLQRLHLQPKPQDHIPYHAGKYRKCQMKGFVLCGY